MGHERLKKALVCRSKGLRTGGADCADVAHERVLIVVVSHGRKGRPDSVIYPPPVTLRLVRPRKDYNMPAPAVAEHQVPWTEVCPLAYSVKIYIKWIQEYLKFRGTHPNAYTDYSGRMINRERRPGDTAFELASDQPAVQPAI